MALQKSGVQLVAENESGFLGAMGRAQKSVQGFEGAVGKTTPTLGGMNFMSLTLATALGGALLNGISAAVSGFFSLGKQAFAVTAEYERMGVSLNTLLAREIKSAGLTDDMGEAFAMATPAARELQNWIGELAILSPFDVQGVAMAYQTLEAYGFLSLGASSVAEAQEKGIVTTQRLTEALINLASVSPLGAEGMSRISYALGQIRTEGKLLTLDLRQLKQAGVPVNDILAEMGYTMADVGKEAISSEEFILKLTESIESDLGGAALAQAGTLAGLANSISDLGKKYLREFFGPINEGTGKIGGILGVVQPLMQKFVDTLMNDKILKGVQTLGLLLGEGLSGGISILGNILNSLIDTIGKPFTQAANSAFSWGSNIIVQLAAGIINAAGSILINAINFVGAILANWFSPGSPPAIAPDLVLWGQAAIGEWLHGFTEADFSVLKGIQQPLQAALQTMLQAGDIDAQGLADTYAEITAGLAEALATGGDPSEIFAKIADEAGAFGPELAELAKRQFELAGGVEAVKLAEQQLADARKAEENAGKAVMQLTQEYNDLLRGGADDATLQAKLEEINAAETAKDLAGAQADEAETQLDIAKDNLDVMQEQVKLQQELVNQLIELARLQAQAIPPESPGGAGGGGGGEPPPPPGIDIPDPGEVIQEFIDDIIAKIAAAAALMFAPITAAWDGMITGILAAWDRFIANLNASGLLTQMQSIWDNAVALAQIGLSILGEFISRGLQTILNLWNTHKEQVSRIWNSFWGLLASIAGGILGLIVSNIDQRLQEARGFFENHRIQVSNIIDLFWANIESAFDVGLNLILTFVQDRLSSIQAIWDTRGVQILGAVDRLWDNISAVFWNVMGILIDFVEESLGKIQDWWDQHGENVEIVVGRFLQLIGSLFDLALLAISTVILFWVDFFADVWGEHGDTIGEIVQGFMDAISAIFETILGAIGAFFDGWAALFQGDWESFNQAISNFWASIWDGIISYLTASVGTVIDIISLFIGTIITYFTDLYNAIVGNSIIPDMLAEIVTAFTEKFDEILTYITEWISGFQNSITTFIGNITSFFTDPDWAGIGSNIIQGIADGISSATGALINAIENAIQNAIDAALNLLDSSSPSKVFKKIGASVSFGLAEGITDERRAPVSAISDTINAMINPPLVTQAAGATYNNSMNVSFQNNIGSGIDIAALDNHILNVVKRGFGGR